MSDEVEPIEAPSDKDLKSVAELARQQLLAERKVARLTTELQEAQRHLKSISMNQLPLALTSIGLSEITLSNGAKVEISEKYRCPQLDDAPSDKKRPLAERLAALRWLNEQGHGDLARRVITIALGKDSEAVVAELLTLINSHRASNQFQVDNRCTVPWNSLAAFVSEQVDQGEDVPFELLGVHLERVSKITEPERK